MPNYLVQWRIDAEEETPQAAARAAWKAMRNPDSIANCFEVIDRETGEVVDVDLSEDADAPPVCLCGDSPANCAAEGCVCQPAKSAAVALAILQEFMEDVQAAGGPRKVGHDWPDLVVTYNKARLAIARAKGGGA